MGGINNFDHLGEVFVPIWRHDISYLVQEFNIKISYFLKLPLGGYIQLTIFYLSINVIYGIYLKSNKMQNYLKTGGSGEYFNFREFTE